MYTSAGRPPKQAGKKAVSSVPRKVRTTVAKVPKKPKGIAGPYVAVPLDSVMLPAVPGETKLELWQRFEHNNTALIVQCVQESTRDTYAVGWRRWISFCNWFSIDPYLRSVPVEWVPEIHTLQFKDFAVVSFMQQLCHEEKLCPGTAGVYMSSVRFHLKVANQDIAFLSSPSVSAARTAITLIYRRDNPVAGRRALPFTCDMLVFAKAKAFNTGSPLHECIVCCMEAGTVVMARVSELIPGKPQVDHWLRAEDVSFRLHDGRVVPSWAIQGIAWSEVCSVIIRIRSGKNDTAGEGHVFEYFTAALGEIRAFDIVQDLYSWAIRARLQKGKPFFSYREESTLSYDVLSAAIKKVASCMGLDPTKFRPHSLRIGGASMLAAAGLPDYVIQKQGRWKSLAFLTYIRLGKRTFTMALDAMVNPTLLTASEVGRYDPGSDWREGGA